MAAYAATVTPADAVAQVLAGTPLRIVRGSVNITNYNPTLAEITGITKFFRTTPTVLLGGISTNGYACSWIPASKSIKCWEDNENATYLPDVAFGEPAADVNIGSVEFVAIGVAP